MDFELDADDALIRDNVREFCRANVVEAAARWDEAGALPREILTGLGDLGLLGMQVPEDRGGVALSHGTAVTVVSELAAADASVALVAAAHNLALGAIVASGGEAAVVDALASGQRIATWIDARSGATAHDVIGLEHADVIVVVDAEGLSIVEAAEAGVDRVETLGLCAAGIGSAAIRVGARTAGVDAHTVAARYGLDVAAAACGIGRRALGVSTAYAKQREQFGKPIASFQAIQWKLADMATTVEAAWLMVQRAAWSWDAGRPDVSAAARATVRATEAAVRAGHDAIQIHGGYGYTREFVPQRLLRDAQGCTLWGGTARAHRAEVAAAIAARFGT